MDTQIFALLVLIVLLNCRGTEAASCHCKESESCGTNFYCKSGCASGFYGPGCQIYNIALHKETLHTGEHSSDLAADGHYVNDSGQPQIYNCTYLPRSSDPRWWQVILGRDESYIVKNVTIFTEPGPLNYRIRYFNIYTGPNTLRYSENERWTICSRNQREIPFTKTYTCENSDTPSRSLVIQIQNTLAYLTLCEVIVDGYEYKECDRGYTGPQCLLRSCANDYCGVHQGVCGPLGGCRFSRKCPENNTLPPECWITFSRFESYIWRNESTNNQITIDGSPRSQPNLVANMVSIEVLSGETKLDYTGKYRYLFAADGSVTMTMDAEPEVSYKVRLTPTLCFRGNVCVNGGDSCFNEGDCFAGSSSEWLLVNRKITVPPTSIPEALLQSTDYFNTLPIKATECPQGYTGPWCRLRSCDYDHCEVFGGVCSASLSCKFTDKCPEESFLPHDCWKTFSNFAKYNWTITAADLRVTINGSPYSQIHFAANFIDLEVRAFGERINITGKYQYTTTANGSLTLTFNVEPDVAYDVYLTPTLCFTENVCVYGDDSCYNSSTCFKGSKSEWLTIPAEMEGRATHSRTTFTTLDSGYDTDNSGSMIRNSEAMVLLFVATSMLLRREKTVP